MAQGVKPVLSEVEGLEWDVIRQDLSALVQTEVRDGDQWYLLRSPLQGSPARCYKPPASPCPHRCGPWKMWCQDPDLGLFSRSNRTPTVEVGPER